MTEKYCKEPNCITNNGGKKTLSWPYTDYCGKHFPLSKLGDKKRCVYKSCVQPETANGFCMSHTNNKTGEYCAADKYHIIELRHSCGRKAQTPSPYCGKHQELHYYDDYPEARKCSHNGGCYRPAENGINKCLNHSGRNDAIQCNAKLFKWEKYRKNCTYRCKEGSEYCGNHSWMNQYIDPEVRMCNRKDSCHNVAVNGRTSCEICYKNGLEGDKTRYSKRREKNLSRESELIEGEAFCRHRDCGTKFVISSVKTLSKKPSTLCLKHYTELCKIESNRIKRFRQEYYRDYESRESTKLLRSKWRKQNSDKKYWIKYRQLKREVDLIGFLERNAIKAKEWRDNNPDKYRAICDRSKMSVIQMLNIYKKCAQ